MNARDKHKFLTYFSKSLKTALETIPVDIWNSMTEIRIRRDKPLIIRAGTVDYFVALKRADGAVNSDTAYYPSEEDVNETFSKMCDYSPYAFEDEIKNGFITLFSGHRVGICGQAVIDNGKIRTIKHIASLNIRISREIFGACKPIIDKIAEPAPKSTLIISPPGMGKTTLLRDIIRQLSDKGYNVAVADERSELGACYMGASQKNMGFRTDVLDGCPKSEGMLLLLRSMSPQVIAVDEIGRPEDIEALLYIMSCGVPVFATIHGGGLPDIKKKPGLENIFGHFERYVLLGNRPGNILGVYDESFCEVE